MSHVQNIESSLLFTKHLVFPNHQQYSCLCMMRPCSNGEAAPLNFPYISYECNSRTNITGFLFLRALMWSHGFPFSNGKCFVS
jgi:hypothetical protein